MKTKSTARSGVTFPLVLLLITAFLASVFGGYVADDSTILPRDFGEILKLVFGGSDAPVLTHTAIAFPLLLALLVVLISHRVQQVPKQILTIIWLIFFIFLGASSVFSSYRSLSMEIWLEWLCYGCAMFGAIAICGRRTGVNLLLASIVAGCFIVSVNGILEYGLHRSTDASWRIFAGWMNPNATAAMLLLGAFSGFGLCLSQARTASLFAGLAAAFMLVATVLTGSKGAVSLALPLGLISFGAFQIRPKAWIIPAFSLATLLIGVVGVLFVKNVGWIGVSIGLAYAAVALGVANRDRMAAARLLAVAGATGAFLALLFVTTPVPKGAPNSATSVATPISRVSEGSHTQEQSSDFRLNLWKSALHLIKERPIQGFGLGSYRNESARAGLTTSTMFSHNIYLQLWSETGIVPFLLFFLGAGVWLKLIATGRIRLPAPQLATLAGVAAAVLSVLIHGFVDSDLSYFGIGIVLFLLFGAGLSLAGDAVAPELIQRPFRSLAAVASCGIALLLLMFSLDDVDKAIVRQDLQTRDEQALKEDIGSLGWASSFDGEARYLQGMSDSPDQIAASLTEAYNMYPTERIARLLANVLSHFGKNSQAIEILRSALERDPNNFNTLSLLAKIQASSGDTAAAVDTAKRLVATESTPYFTVRSIPEGVPTQTFDARLNFLAPNASNPQARAKLLSEAVHGYVDYARTTLPTIRYYAVHQNHDDNFQMPGYDTMAEARKKIESAIEGGEQAIQIYRKTGGTEEAAAVEADVAFLRASLAA